MSDIFSKTVKVGVGARLSQDGRVPGCDLPTPFPVQGACDDDRPAVGLAVSDEPVNEVNDVVGQSDGDLLAHTIMVSVRDANQKQSGMQL